MTATARQLTKDVVVEQPRKLYATCGYCGGNCYGRTCQGHSDLPQLEHEIYTENNAPSRTSLPGARPGAST